VFAEESFADFAFFTEIRKSFFRKKSIIYKPQRFFRNNYEKSNFSLLFIIITPFICKKYLKYFEK